MRAPRFLRRALALFGWSARDADMSEEMRHHLESLTDDLVRSGMTATPPSWRRAGDSAACCA
jgi:hypothetical protein